VGRLSQFVRHQTTSKQATKRPSHSLSGFAIRSCKRAAVQRRKLAPLTSSELTSASSEISSHVYKGVSTPRRIVPDDAKFKLPRCSDDLFLNINRMEASLTWILLSMLYLPLPRTLLLFHAEFGSPNIAAHTRLKTWGSSS
jgi:hypothetical protein